MRHAKKRWLAALFVAVLAALTLTAAASADVQRYQLQTGTIDVTWAGSLLHTFTIDSPGINPCDGSFTAHGISYQGMTVHEHVVGTLVDGILTYTATYYDTAPYDGYQWWYSGPLTGGFADSSMGEHSTVTIQPHLTVTTSYRNHGAYVTATGGGDDAAHSCIGRPIAWSQTGTVDSHSATGTTVTLPDTGTYRITVSGTWQNGTWWLVDPEYVQQYGDGTTGLGSDGSSGHTLGWYDSWPSYTVDFGDLQVNGQFVDWGSYSSNHVYSQTMPFAASTVTLSVWDMWGDLVTDGHADNSGSLNFTITYVGP